MTIRHFLRDDDISPAEQAEILALAEIVKADRLGGVADRRRHRRRELGAAEGRVLHQSGAFYLREHGVGDGRDERVAAEG